MALDLFTFGPLVEISSFLLSASIRKLALIDVGHRVFDYAHEIFSLGNELIEFLWVF